VTDPFRDYHRARHRTAVVRVLASVVLVGGLGGGLTALAAAAPEPAVVRSAASTPTASVEEPAPTALPEPAASAPPAPPPEPEPLAAAGGPRSWSIHVDTAGYQAEIDQCLWVRMDLGLDAPIIGAHNYCGGSVVLEMQLGDTVALAGAGLDGTGLSGTYIVASERDARAGDNAAAATAGFEAAVILQTCYWVDDGSERLLALLPLTP